MVPLIVGVIGWGVFILCVWLLYNLGRALYRRRFVEAVVADVQDIRDTRKAESAESVDNKE